MQAFEKAEEERRLEAERRADVGLDGEDGEVVGGEVSPGRGREWSRGQERRGSRRESRRFLSRYAGGRSGDDFTKIEEAISMSTGSRDRKVKLDVLDSILQDCVEV